MLIATSKIGSFTKPLSPIVTTPEESLAIARHPSRASKKQDVLAKRVTSESGRGGWQAWGRKRNPLGAREPQGYQFMTFGRRAKRINAGTGQDFIYTN